MEVIIKKGVYGLRTGAGRVRPVAKGERAELPDKEAARLEKLGIAECVSPAKPKAKSGKAEAAAPVPSAEPPVV